MYKDQPHSYDLRTFLNQHITDMRRILRKVASLLGHTEPVLPGGVKVLGPIASLIALQDLERNRLLASAFLQQRHRLSVRELQQAPPID